MQRSGSQRALGIAALSLHSTAEKESPDTMRVLLDENETHKTHSMCPWTTLGRAQWPPCRDIPLPYSRIF
ncbi:hypothetical protein CY34DRAFT_800764 [Suillus luteus UH-Slu-Lm8-n1]|uniref:Unplaced genomic scaffold CY34scaffold_32, whole genome shotgun sequence n=1 Tax=Suillus luteus UH-Slu-Lm8-n1 TaxID=930992 RepID=A0A0D0AWL2_9AGAM|nr:hypothetical protein CY34DRAFT_800764 [Suillus luteus UH-Slu-Lm8-n1]